MSPRSRRLGAVALVALVPTAALGGYALAAGAPVREDLAGSRNPVGAQGRTLGLARVTIPAGAQLASHTHPGTEIAHIDEGTLTYTVERGTPVTVWRGEATDDPQLVRRIRPGQTAKLRAGQWIVEQPKMVHHAANQTSKRVVILLSTLFPNGAPQSIPVPAPGR
jgi:quercetin dioxygenase-like cupin family protein